MFRRNTQSVTNWHTISLKPRKNKSKKTLPKTKNSTLHLRSDNDTGANLATLGLPFLNDVHSRLSISKEN